MYLLVLVYFWNTKGTFNTEYVQKEALVGQEIDVEGRFSTITPFRPFEPHKYVGYSEKIFN